MEVRKYNNIIYWRDLFHKCIFTFWV